MQFLRREERRDHFSQWLPLLFYRAQNRHSDAGHIRLFSFQPNRGWVVFAWHGEYPIGWSRRRVWNFYFFAIHHIDDQAGALKSTEPGGWHVTWARLEIKRIHGGFSVAWRKADTYRVGRR